MNVEHWYKYMCKYMHRHACKYICEHVPIVCKYSFMQECIYVGMYSMDTHFAQYT